jgi:hypothetical protein
MDMAPNDSQVLNKPIIIIGAPRSGTTMLGEFLEAHHSLYCAMEPRLIWRYGNDRKSDMLRADDATPRVVNYIRREFARQVQAADRSRLLEKTPSNALRIEFVNRVFPDAKFVHIIRNPLDSVLSIRSFWLGYSHGVTGIAKGRIRQRLKEAGVRRLPYYAMEAVGRLLPKPLSGLCGPRVWGPRLPGMRGLVRDLDLLEVCCLQWRMCVEAACQQGRKLPPDRYLECRLEDMSPDSMRSILQFCELEDDPAVWKQLEERFDPTKAGARKVQADPLEIQRINQWIEPTAQWLGYR